MRQRSFELWYTLPVIALITLAYVIASIHLNAVPEAGGLGGHLLGVLGFVLMIMTETLYSLRKSSSRAARWGSMHWWLQFHIFTGVVGPYMVLLHTSWKFNGLAGAVTLLTLLIVLSGFIGRYVYTAVPRTADGLEVDSGTLESQINATKAQVEEWLAANPEVSRAVSENMVVMPRLPNNAWLLILERVFLEWSYRRRWWSAEGRMKGQARNQLKQLDRLFTRRRELHYQMASLSVARHILSLWHSVHVPLGVALFAAAFIHIGAALYFVTLAK